MKIAPLQYWDLLVKYLKPQKKRVAKFASALLVSFELGAT
jgi:hypothetical protein